MKTVLLASAALMFVAGASLSPASAETNGPARWHNSQAMAQPVKQQATASLALEALSREAFILFPRASNPELYDNIVLACGRAGLTPNIVQQAPEIASTLNLIAAGEGVSIVPASMQHMQSQAVAYRGILDDAPRAPLGFAYRSNEPSAAVRNLAALARRAAANLGGDILARAG